MDFGGHRPIPGRKSQKICTLTISSYSALEELRLVFFTFTQGTVGKKNYGKKKKKEASHSHHASLCMYVCPFSRVCTYSDKVTEKGRTGEKK